MEGTSGYPWFNPVLRVGAARTGGWEMCQVRFCVQNWWGLHGLSGQTVPIFDLSHSFLRSDKISWLLVCVHCLLSCQWSLLRVLDYIFFIPFHYVLIFIDKIPLEPHFSRLNSPSSLSLFSCGRHSNPVVNLCDFTGAQHIAPVCLCLSCRGTPELDTTLQVCLTSVG